MTTNNNYILDEWVQAIKNHPELKGEIQAEELLKFMDIRKEKAEFGYDMVTLGSKSSGGTSRKIRNISFDLGNIFTFFASGGIGILSGLTPTPYGKWYTITATATAILLLIREIVKAYSVPIDNREGLVLWVLHALTYHQISGLSGDCSENNVLRCINIVTEKDKLPEMKAGELRDILNKLRYLKCVKQAGDQWEPLEIVIVKPKE